MGHINIEIKARTARTDALRKVLKEEGAVFKGVDFQTDTYFHCAAGRMKLREGNIENTLIHYRREDKEGPKESVVSLYHPQPDSNLKELLENALGVLVSVRKKREIYFVDNVKFHLDEVDGLGTFVEIEAIQDEKHSTAGELREQCTGFMDKMNIREEDLCTSSYSDMILEKDEKR